MEKLCRDCKHYLKEGWEVPCTHCMDETNYINHTKWVPKSITLDQILGLEESTLE